MAIYKNRVNIFFNAKIVKSFPFNLQQTCPVSLLFNITFDVGIRALSQEKRKHTHDL